MTDPAMWSRAKQVATYIVREWMLLEADKRIMSTLVEEIELELDRSFEAGIRAANHVAPLVAPLIRAQVLEEAAKVAENHIFYSTNFGPPLKQLEEQIAAAIRALKEHP